MKTSDGTEYRHNRCQLLKTKGSCLSMDPFDSEIQSSYEIEMIPPPTSSQEPSKPQTHATPEKEATFSETIVIRYGRVV